MQLLPPFKLEEFWKKYEFTAPYLLCCSDAESFSMNEILELADPESKELWNALTLGYTESTGLPLLRKEIAKLYQSIDSEEVLTFAGAEEGIYCLMRTLVNPGDHVIVIDPSYQSLSDLPLSMGAHITRIKLEAQKQWQLEIEDLIKSFQKNTKLLILNYPHNPTGALLKKEVFDKMIELAKESGAYIFSDEVYRTLEIDEAKRLPSIADAYEKGIALNVMTKAFGLAGLRIGWLATHATDVLQKAASYKLYTSICNSAPSEILALMALRAKDRVLARNRAIMVSNLNLLDSFMQRHETILSWVKPESGPITVLKLLLPQSVEQFAEELVKRSGVLVMPGSVFDLGGNYFRIGFAKKNMPPILERFEKYLTQ